MADTYRSAATELFHNTEVRQLFPEEHGRIFSVTTDTPIAQVFKTLVENKILSVPVLNTKTHKWVGFLDMVDLVHHALSVLSIPKSELDTADFDQLLASSDKFANEPCGSIVDLSKRNPYNPVDQRAPVTSAIDMMVNWRVHRVPVVDTSGELITIVTQSHVARLIYKWIARFEQLADSTVEQLKLGYADVITVREDEEAIAAFRLIHERGVSAVGVVNAEGRLVGNVSASDLKAIGYDGKLLARLFVPVSEFVKETRPEGVGAITVAPRTSFGQVLDKLVSNHIHRVYVVDESQGGKPIGVISLLEILKTFHQ